MLLAISLLRGHKSKPLDVSQLDLRGEVATFGRVKIVIDDLGGGSGSIRKDLKFVWFHQSAQRKFIEINTSDRATNSFHGRDGMFGSKGNFEMDGGLELRFPLRKGRVSRRW